MSLVLYLLAGLCLARASVAFMLARWAMSPWLEVAVASWVALEVAVAVGLGLAARSPVRNLAAVWLGAALIVSRLGLDVWGALRFPPDLAMACLLDLVLHLALFSGWLRAIPDVIRAPGWSGSTGLLR